MVFGLLVVLILVPFGGMGDDAYTGGGYLSPRVSSSTDAIWRAGSDNEPSNATITFTVAGTGTKGITLAPQDVVFLMDHSGSLETYDPQVLRILAAHEYINNMIAPFDRAVVAFFGVIVLGTLQGILVAVIISILALLYLASNPPVYQVGRMPGTNVFRALKDHPDDQTFPGLLILRTEGVMFFTSAPYAIDQIGLELRGHEPKIVVLDCSAVPNFEYTAVKQFSDFDELLSTVGIELWLVALNREAFETVEKTQLGKRLGHERMFHNLEQAVEVYQAAYPTLPLQTNEVDRKSSRF